MLLIDLLSWKPVSIKYFFLCFEQISRFPKWIWEIKKLKQIFSLNLFSWVYNHAYACYEYAINRIFKVYILSKYKMKSAAMIFLAYNGYSLHITIILNYFYVDFLIIR